MLNTPLNTIKFISLLTNAITTEMNMEEMFHKVLNIFCKELKWEIGHVYYGSTLNGECDLIPTKIWCFSGTESRYSLFKISTESRTIKLREGIIGDTIDQEKALWVPHESFNKKVSRTRIAESLGIRTALTMPIYLDGRIIAVIEFFTEKIIVKDNAVLELLNFLGSLIGYIIERNWAEEGLRESENKFKNIFQNSLDAIILAEESGIIIGCNEAALKLFDYSEKEILGKPIEMLMPSKYRKAHREGILRLVTTGESKFIGQVIRVEAKNKNNEVFPVDLALTSWKTHKGYLFSGAIRKSLLDIRPENEV